MTDIISKTKAFNHPIDKVWKAISEADKISSWFIQADFKAEKGFQYTFKHENTVITGEVIAANPVHELVYTWIVGGTNVSTTVSWKLQEQDNKTILILEHSGISNYPEASAVAMFTNFEGGWQACLENLHKFLK